MASTVSCTRSAWLTCASAPANPASWNSGWSNSPALSGRHYWDLPGGMAEANEWPADALRRELREKLGLDI